MILGLEHGSQDASARPMDVSLRVSTYTAGEPKSFTMSSTLVRLNDASEVKVKDHNFKDECRILELPHERGSDRRSPRCPDVHSGREAVMPKKLGRYKRSEQRMELWIIIES